MEYRICPYCGAALDPGERCDCQDPGQLQEAEPEEIIFTGSLAELAAELEAEQGERGDTPQAVRTRTLLATTKTQRRGTLQP